MNHLFIPLEKDERFLLPIQGFLILVQELYSDYIDTTLRETTQHHLHNTYKQHLQLPSWVIRQEAEVKTVHDT